MVWTAVTVRWLLLCAARSAASGSISPSRHVATRSWNSGAHGRKPVFSGTCSEGTSASTRPNDEVHMNGLTQPQRYPGKLIVVEGIDGSGKSTQLQLAMRYLQARGLPTFFTEWNSADLVKAVTKKGKKKMALTP